MKKLSLLTLLLLTTLNVNAQKSKYALLQGKWQHTDDKTNFLVFQKNQRFEIAEGMDTWDVSTFTISDGCQNEGNLNNEIQPESNKYLTSFDENGGLCWYIVELSATRLTLSYVSRGNTLSYRRVVNKRKR